MKTMKSPIMRTSLASQAQGREMAVEEKGKGSERWSGATTNLTEMASNLESLQKLLLKKAVFVDEETFAKASLSSEQARTIKVDRSLFDLVFRFNSILFLFVCVAFSDILIWVFIFVFWYAIACFLFDFIYMC
jgi:Flp pilus assembly protein TadB